MLLNKAIDNGEKVMFEGAQGALLDRPWDVSVCDLLFIHGRRCGHRHRRRPARIGTVIGVTKAYVTRVGEGPFPTEIHDSTSDLLRALAGDGAVTGRPRRCGWLDLPLLRYSDMINGTEWLVVTKMDVMDECAEIPVCTGYKINGKLTDVIPPDMPGYNAIVPVYTKLKGWKSSTEGITEFDKLPQLAQDYLKFVEKESGQGLEWFRPGLIATRP